MSKKVILICSIFVIVIIAISGVVATIGNAGDLKDIKANPKQTTAKIVESDNLNEYNTNGCWIYFEYTVDGRHYKHCQKYHGWEKKDNYFIGYTFPLVYSVSDPDKARLLIIADEFEVFGISQPDSLKKYNGRIL